MLYYSFQEGEQYAKRNGLIFMEASARTGENVDECFITTSAHVLEGIQQGKFNLKDEVSLCVCYIYPSYIITYYIDILIVTWY